jgi:DNA-binding beta-propeller fold protein YncE
MTFMHVAHRSIPARSWARRLAALVVASLVTLSVTQTTPSGARSQTSSTRHLEYVFTDHLISVFDIDRGQRLVQQIPLPQIRAIRGVAVSPSSHLLYVSYGGDGGGGAGSTGALAAIDLLTNQVRWQREYGTGIDSLSVTPDGKTIYLPTGELSHGADWLVIDARTGAQTGVVTGGAGPHNTVVGLDGRYAYLGGRSSVYLTVVRTKDNKVVRQIGPLKDTVRPFTINGRQTLAYTTATGFLGFQVSSIRTGRVLFTVPVPGFSYNPATFAPSAPSHGISLSPDERELYLIDAPNSYVHVFDVHGGSKNAPRPLKDIKLAHPLTGDEDPCVYDCARDGWIQHSRSGRYVYVGDSGDVIDTRTRRVIAYLPALRETRKMLEIDWRNGVPIATTSRSGLGYVTG